MSLPSSHTNKTAGRVAKRRLIFDEDRPDAEPMPKGSTLSTSTTDGKGSSFVSPHRKKKNSSGWQPPNSSLSGKVTAAKTTYVKKDSAAAVVTPEVAASKEYVPRCIHSNVEYSRKGQIPLSPVTKKAFEMVSQRFVIPENLEQSRGFGPLSGSCYEERVLQAYTLGLLKPHSMADRHFAVCTTCGHEGHKRSDCPTLV